MTIDSFRNSIPIDNRPSHIKMTTITMISKFENVDLNLDKLRPFFEELGSFKIRLKGSKSSGFEWKYKPSTRFFNQFTLTYTDEYSTKSVKIFPNGSVHVTGCSDLLNCHLILKQIKFIFKNILDQKVLSVTYKIVMINTNFSLNYHVNLHSVLNTFSNDDMFMVSFEPDRYSAVKIKFKPSEEMKKVTASIFGTGKIIITGARTLKEIAFAYDIINQKINSDPSIKVKKTDEIEVFDIILGYKISDWIVALNKKNIKPWKRD
jgi:TATA-box binding protein (TBP) (component of TFIID and TFIIIB)